MCHMLWRNFKCRQFWRAHPAVKMLGLPVHWVNCRQGQAGPSVRMHSVKANVMPYYTVTHLELHSLFDIITIWLAQHFEADLNLYNTGMVDYTIVNNSPVGCITVVYKTRHPIHE